MAKNKEWRAIELVAILGVFLAACVGTKGDTITGNTGTELVKVEAHELLPPPTGCGEEDYEEENWENCEEYFNDLDLDTDNTMGGLSEPDEPCPACTTTKNAYSAALANANLKIMDRDSFCVGSAHAKLCVDLKREANIASKQADAAKGVLDWCVGEYCLLEGAAWKSDGSNGDFDSRKAAIV